MTLYFHIKIAHRLVDVPFESLLLMCPLLMCPLKACSRGMKGHLAVTSSKLKEEKTDQKQRPKNDEEQKSNKLLFNLSRTDIRKYFFVARVVPIWNNLPALIVNSENVNRFKNGLNVLNFNNLCRGRAYKA